jgi:threonine dehydrogenase-like Zn-dependent dehydrogenase
VVPFTIACGACFYCRRGLSSLCDNSNPNAWMAEGMYGHSGSGLFGYSHMLGGYAGGQAEFVRVPYADVGPIKIPPGLRDEDVLFLSDILPTAYMAAENCEIQPGDTVAVWGCGPVGLLSIRCAFLLGAERVIAIDDVPERLERARAIGADTLDFSSSNDGIVEALRDATFGMGPDACIDAVGLEARGHSPVAAYDYVKQTLRLTTDRPLALRQALQACRKGGNVSVPGVYGGYIDKAPVGAWFGKGLTLKGGQTHVHRYMAPLLDRIRRGELDPTFVISHRIGLDEVPSAYETFAKKADGCVKVVIQP